MYPHRIRLRSPWMLEASGKPIETTSLPFLATQEAVLRRKFGAPRRLDDFERVWLTVGADSTTLKWSLNGSVLRFNDQFEADVTEALAARNELAVKLLANSLVNDEVALEVRCRAFLRFTSVQRESESTVQVRTDVVGTSDGLLELYVLISGSTVHYQTIVPSQGGTSFQAVFPVESTDVGVPVRIELVRGAVVWHRFETDFR